MKDRRLECGITLKTLAERCDVTSSMLSQIEKGKASPSLSTLSKIVAVLNTTIGAVVDGEVQKSQKTEHLITRLQDRKKLDDNDADLTMCVLTEQSPYKLMQPMLFSFHTKGKDNGFRYQHFGQEFVLVLTGSIEVILGDQRYLLEAGDSMYFNSSTPHLFLNTSDGLSEALSIDSPPNF